MRAYYQRMLSPSGKRQESRAYQCPSGNGWHVTSHKNNDMNDPTSFTLETAPLA